MWSGFEDNFCWPHTTWSQTWRPKRDFNLLSAKQEEEKAREKSALEAAEKEAALARMHQMKALSLRPEPEYGADVTQVKFPFCL
ncbi:hypothetical protein RHMOL_Rhmol07G0095900 [Rhododendron molle]|uniref:Uncharacterized protein n=1 Tax=Rhododendron molle TaxID=49168 RepID=A0ACC0MZ28_RHOML|nr:hypothetical protein RHMOL_Rhmol07G0095900 [Rhododendron molle]